MGSIYLLLIDKLAINDDRVETSREVKRASQSKDEKALQVSTW